MNVYKQPFSNYTSEHLIEKRALGNELADEAHKAIEEIFAERGEYLPPKPTQTIDVSSQKKKQQSWFEISGWIFVLLFVNGISEFIAQTWIGYVISVCFFAYLLAKWLHEKSLSTDEKQELDEQKKIADDGLYELMVSAAKGDLVRVGELIDYGADVNVVSVNGSTALMYASRNNQIKIAEKLILAGANVNAKNDKKSTPLTIAEKQQHYAMIELLKQHGAK